MTNVFYRSVWVDGQNVNKVPLRAGFSDFVPLYFDNVEEFRATDTAGHRSVIVDGFVFTLDGGSPTEVDDGVNAIESNDGYLYSRVNTWSDGFRRSAEGFWQFDVSDMNDGDSDRSQFEIFASGGTQSNIASTTYSDIVGGGTMHCKYARGSRAAPSQVLSGDLVGGYGCRAYHSGGAFQISSPASMHWIASENQGPNNYGMYLRFLTNPKGTNVRQERVIIADVGTLWAHDTATYDPRVETQTKPFPDVTVLGSSAAASGAAGNSLGSVHYAGAGSSSPGFRGGGARGTPAAPTASQANDFLAFVGGHGYGATGWTTATKALIGMKAAENWSDTAQGTYMTFETTLIGGTTRTERMRILDTGIIRIPQAGKLSWRDNAGTGDIDVIQVSGDAVLIGSGTGQVVRIIPGIAPLVDNTIENGSSGLRWTAVYAVNGTIQTSDEVLKKSIAPLDFAALDLIDAITPIRYCWRAPRGQARKHREPDKRVHWGFGARQVRECVEAAGLDFGGHEVSESGVEMLNYSQLVPVLWKALQELWGDVKQLAAAG